MATRLLHLSVAAVLVLAALAQQPEPAKQTQPKQVYVRQIKEPPEKAAKLLKFAAQLEVNAQQAVDAGRASAVPAAPVPSKSPKMAHIALQNRPPAPSDSGTAEQLINQRTQGGNAISVGPPKIYDDALLQQMLASAQMKLASLQGFDQSGITRAIGNITGANQRIAAFGLTAQGPLSTTTTVGNETPVTTSSVGFATPSPTNPTPSTTLPAPTGGSASDILNEQLQLTSEITNLSLLLEGPLSDQIVEGKGTKFVRPRVTLGFPVAISPEKRFRNAVAVVEVFVQTNRQNDVTRDGAPPAITALLPQEKTYNVASISDKSVSLGGGIATALAGVSASFLWGRKTYYIVKDQDTLAVTFEPTMDELRNLKADPPRTAAFAWQFRPVLGQEFVQPGMKQVFVQLAFPGQRNARAEVHEFGSVRVRTYWREFDPKKGILKDVVSGSLIEASFNPAPIPIIDMQQNFGAVALFRKDSMEDLGTGQMLLKLQDRLLPGTYLRVGSTVIQPGTSIQSDLNATRFVANISDLATLGAYVVSRDGTEVPLELAEPCAQCPQNAFVVDRDHVTSTIIDDSNSLLKIPISGYDPLKDMPPVLVIGGKVFGYADSPIDRFCEHGKCSLVAALPTGFLASNPLITVKPLLTYEKIEQKANRTFPLFLQSAETERLSFLAQDSDSASYLMYGHNLQAASVVWPALKPDGICDIERICLRTVASGPDDGTLRLVKLPISFAKNGKQLIIERANERPFPLGIPAPPTPGAAEPAKADPTFKERVTVGSDEATIVGDGLDAVSAVTYKGRPLVIRKKTSSAINLAGLAAAGATATARTTEVSLVSLSGATNVKLEVVNMKVETVEKK